MRSYIEAPRDLRLDNSVGYEFSDFHDITLVQFRVALFFPAIVRRRRISAFLLAVNSVVPSSADEQVIRSNARRVVATVQHMKTGWNRPDIDDPRDPMRLICPAVDVKFSIPTVASVTSPDPAPFIWLLEKRLKLLDYLLPV